MLKRALNGGAQLLEANKEEVNSLNVFPVPDGDTGTNMSLTIKSAVKQGLATGDESVSKIALGASQGSLMGARGNSGVILSQLFRGFALGLSDKDEANVEDLANGFKSAADTAYKAVMKPTEGTILTVARECGEFAMENYKNYSDILEFLKALIEYGDLSLSKTPDLLPVLKQAGVVDAGGKGLMYIIKGAYNSLSGQEEYIIEPFVDEEQRYQDVVEHKDLKPEDIKYGYCTEFMIKTDSKDIDELRRDLSVRGDSLMVVGGEGIIKVHVHTNNPGLALERALKAGALTDIKIDNMRMQYERVAEKKSEKPQVDKENAFVAISIGDGIDDVFKGLNVDVLVSGGQTMNPSTEDILAAINRTSGRNVFVLPNNSNIILAAEQAKELSDRNVVVVPTKTIPEGISAVLNFDEELTWSDNEKAMNEGIRSVKTGEVTFSVRDTEIDGKVLNKDDVLGIFGKEIVANGKDLVQVAEELLDRMIDEDTSLVTILYGEDLEETTAEEFASRIEEKYDDIDIELVYGGQPLYYYIFSVE